MGVLNRGRMVMKERSKEKKNRIKKKEKKCVGFLQVVQSGFLERLYGFCCLLLSE